MKIKSTYRVISDDTDGVVSLNDVGPVRNGAIGGGVRRGQKSNLAEIGFRYNISNIVNGRV